MQKQEFFNIIDDISPSYKECSKCGEVKDLRKFNFICSASRICAHCNECNRKRNKEYYYRNIEKNRLKKKLYIYKNKDRRNKYAKKWRIKNRNRVINYRRENRNKNIEYARQYRIRNKDKINKYIQQYYHNPETREQRRIYKKNKYKNNIQYKISQNIRRRILAALKKKRKMDNTINLIGCSISSLMNYLESKFQYGMSWENHGFGDNKWHIDHIIPCVTFDLTKEEEQRKCFHYTNLQPLWQKENLSKGDKYVV